MPNETPEATTSVTPGATGCALAAANIASSASILDCEV